METLSFAMERDDLNQRFGGGLPRGSLVVVEGPHGTGKSVFTQRLASGLVANGHSVSFVSTELTTGGFMGQMSSLDFEIVQPMVEERMVFIPVYPLLGVRAPRHDLLRRLVKARKMYAKDVIVFDSFSKFLVDHVRSFGDSFKGMEQVESALYQFKRLTSGGKTIILTFETGHVREELTNLFKDAADLYLTLKYELLGNVSARRIIVHRMARAAGRFSDVIGYRVEPGIGMVVEIRSVV